MVDILMPALSPTMEEGTLAKVEHQGRGHRVVRPGDRRNRNRQGDHGGQAVDEGVVTAILVEAGSESGQGPHADRPAEGEGEAVAPLRAALAPAASSGEPERPLLRFGPRPRSRLRTPRFPRGPSWSR